MIQTNRMLRYAWALAAAALVAVVLAACGSGGDATQLLQQTFQGSHSINSGNVHFSLTVTPSGSKTITSPVSLTFSGPFQSQGTGKLPHSNFTLSVNFQGHTGSLGIISTGTAGYVTLKNTAYQLPASTFQRLESSFANVGAGGTTSLSKLGINPLNWLTNPTIVGDEDVAGTPTVHIHAGINVSAFLNDLNRVIQNVASKSGNSTLSGGLSSSTINRIAGQVQNPSFDVWTGKSDKTVRRIQVNLGLPVTGQLSSLLGGLTNAGLGLSVEYAQLNQPQTIATPTNVQPYGQFTAKLQSLVTQIRGALGGLGGGAGSAGGAGGLGLPGGSSGSSSGGTPGAPANVQAYTQCIQQASGDVNKMQACAKLLSGH